MVEPVKAYYEQLTQAYPGRDNIQYVNCAIMDEEGEMEITTINPELVESGKVPHWANGVSTFYPEKNAMHTLEGSTKETVVCKRLDTILSEYNVGNVDILQIDVEGADLAVFKQAINCALRPKVIIIEVVTMSDEELAQLQHLLWALEYTYARGKINRENIIAVKR